MTHPATRVEPIPHEVEMALRRSLSEPDKRDLPPNPKQAYGDKKVPLHLIPPVASAFCAMALKEGARKYGAYNWRDNGVEQMTYIGAALRHIGQYQDGEEIDEESGNPHLAHAMACLAILIDSKELGNSIDNRPAKGTMSATLKNFAT